MKKFLKNMGYKCSPEASQELHEAYLWYEEQYPGLGLNFVQDIKSSIQTILKFPTGWPMVGKYTKRCLLIKYPYLLLYTYEDNEVYITCIGHQHRDPNFYKTKIE